MELLLKDIWKFLTNRLFILFCLFVIAFYILLVRLFNLQIIRGEDYLNNLNNSVIRRISVDATRGTIYDRFGRPLATNEMSFSLKIDPSIRIHDFTDLSYRLMIVLERFDEHIIDTFPISQEEPYVFLFNDSIARENRWKEDMTVPEHFNAAEAIEYLRGYFNVPEHLSNEEARKVLNIRSAIFMERFQFRPVTLAIDINPETIAFLEEQNDQFQGVYVEIDSLRSYPQGRYVSHIVGYTRLISSEELEEFEQYGYTSTDIVGKDGVERVFELDLRGTPGEMFIEVQTIGRRVTNSVLIEPVPGDKVYLTLDANLQKEAYLHLEETLTQILLNRLTGIAVREAPVTVKDIIIGLTKGNHISISKIVSSEEYTTSHEIKTFLLNELPENQYTTTEEFDELKTLLIDSIDKNNISIKDMMLIMYEQQIIDADEDLLERINTGSATTLRQIIIDKITNKELTPHMIGIEPFSGSVVVTSVDDGSVIAAVTYPAYDNNQFVHNFNSYYTQLMNDPTRPLINRAFWEPVAPGSTFKMITALAGLEEGIINPNTLIRDGVVFTRAGWPYASCMSSVSHGSINVATALSVSCNYFFYDVAFRLGGTTLQNIEILNKYAIDFGLDSATGVEIPELSTIIFDSANQDYVTRLSSPEFMQYLNRQRHGTLNVPWTDGDTIRTAIGQSFNSYTAAVMGKYINTLANGGTRYSLHMLDRIEAFDGELLKMQNPTVELELEMSEQNLRVVHQGMLDTTQSGTARTIFQGFPIEVGGKTGTAEEQGRSHSSFGGFAPYNDPQIAVYVVIPRGDNSTVSAPATRVARAVMETYFGLNYEPENKSLNNSLSR